MFKRIGFALAIGVALITWGMAETASSLADETPSPTAETTCKYQGETYPAGELVCWHDGYWRKCDGSTGRWVNLKQKCKLV